MASNFITLQHKRGPVADIPTLADGEFYFAEDIEVLYVGSANSGNFPISATVPWALPQHYGTYATGSGKQAYHGTMASGSTTLNLYNTGDNTGNTTVLGDQYFSEGDVGDDILVSGQSGTNNAQVFTTISAYISPISVTLATAAPTDGYSGGINGVTIDAGGSGNAEGDVLTVVQGSDSTCTLTVTAVSSGAVTAVSISGQGSGYFEATGVSTTSSGSGSGCTVNITSINYSSEVYWWENGQDDSAAIQAAINSGLPHVYMPAGVYVCLDSLPFTYSPTLRELSGEGTEKTVLIVPNDDPGESFFNFADAHDLSIHDFSTRGAGQDGVYGGDWFFNAPTYGNIERVKFWNLVIEHAASPQALYMDTPILCSFRNVKIVYNAGLGMYLYGAVSCNIDDCYVLTNFGQNFLIDSCYAVHFSGCAAEACGIHYYFLDSYACSMDACDSEQPSHQAPAAPVDAPTVSSIDGGTISPATYYVAYTWDRRENSISLDLESLPSPIASVVLSEEAGIGVTVPAAPTDAPNVNDVYIYIGLSDSLPDLFQNGPYSIPDGGGQISVDSLSGSSVTPPVVSAIGHHIIVSGGANISVRDCTFNSVPTTQCFFTWITQSAGFVNLDNLNIIPGSVTPAYFVQIDSSCAAVTTKIDLPLSDINDQGVGDSIYTSDQSTLGSAGVLTLSCTEVDNTGELTTGRISVANAGTPTITSSSGWGSGATVEFNALVPQKDTAFTIEIITGTSPSANPTVTISFSKAFTDTPVSVANEATVNVGCANSTTEVVLTYVGTPEASTTYYINVITLATS